MRGPSQYPAVYTTHDQLGSVSSIECIHLYQVSAFYYSLISQRRLPEPTTLPSLSATCPMHSTCVHPVTAAVPRLKHEPAMLDSICCAKGMYDAVYHMSARYWITMKTIQANVRAPLYESGMPIAHTRVRMRERRKMILETRRLESNMFFICRYKRQG